jgi:hypothetical protein
MAVIVWGVEIEIVFEWNGVIVMMRWIWIESSTLMVLIVLWQL